MNKPRKTRDCWRFYLDYGYGQGWEHEITEYTREEMKVNKHAYLENCPQYRLKIVKGRERIEANTPNA
jgi:hypothetical protein